MRIRIGVVCLALGIAAGAQATFQTTTRLVNVGFTARDADGQLVTDLKADEIEVVQDGLPQKVAFFSPSQDLPLNLGVVMDISGSQSDSRKKHLSDLKDFLQGVLRTNDQAFLVCFGMRLQLVSDATPSGATLFWTLQHFESRYGYPELGPRDADRDGGSAVFDAVRYSIEEKMTGRPGRHVLLLYSDGEDNASGTDEATAIAAAEAADTTIYTIRYIENKHLNARDRYGIQVMDHLADHTGGLAIDGRQQEPKQYLPRIEQELRASYEVAYYPSESSGPGFHRILVRCRRPGVVVHARQGFTEGTKTTPSPGI